MVPTSSSLPQRFQLLRSFFHCSKSFVTAWLGALVLWGARAFVVMATTKAAARIPSASVFDIGASILLVEGFYRVPVVKCHVSIVTCHISFQIYLPILDRTRNA